MEPREFAQEVVAFIRTETGLDLSVETNCDGHLIHLAAVPGADYRLWLAIYDSEVLQIGATLIHDPDAPSWYAVYDYGPFGENAAHFRSMLEDLLRLPSRIEQTRGLFSLGFRASVLEGASWRKLYSNYYLRWTFRTPTGPRNRVYHSPPLASIKSKNDAKPEPSQ